MNKNKLKIEDLPDNDLKAEGVEGVVLNTFLDSSFLKDLEREFGPGYHLAANHLDFAIIKTKEGESDTIGEVEGTMHIGYPSPKDYNESKAKIIVHLHTPIKDPKILEGLKNKITRAK